MSKSPESIAATPGVDARLGDDDGANREDLVDRAAPNPLFVPRCPLLELRLGVVGRRWACARDIRRTVVKGLSLLLNDERILHRSEMIAEELAENVFKYSDWTHETKPSFYLSLDAERRRVLMRTTNAVRSTDGHLDRLQKILKNMETTSPNDAYGARILELCENPEEATRLGLLRMVCEGECALDAKIEADGMLTMEAVLYTDGVTQEEYVSV